MITKVSSWTVNYPCSILIHRYYADSAYIFVGGLNSELTEGDVITIFSQ